MRNLFKEYCRFFDVDFLMQHWKEPSDDELYYKTLWETATFVIDANVLLALFKFESDTVKKVFEIFRTIKGRVQLPYHAGKEFFINYRAVEESVAKQFDEILKSIAELAKLTNIEALKNTSKELEKQKKVFLVGSKNKHDIFKSIFEIFNTNTWHPLSISSNDFIQRGEIRFALRIPPGFQDQTKGSIRQYGDFMIWLEMLSYAKRSKKPILFISNDTKNDWRNKDTKKPHVMLRQEMYFETKQQFYQYSLKDFMNLSNKYLGISVKPKILKEIETKSTSYLTKYTSSYTPKNEYAGNYIQLTNHAKLLPYLIENNNFFECLYNHINQNETDKRDDSSQGKE